MSGFRTRKAIGEGSACRRRLCWLAWTSTALIACLSCRVAPPSAAPRALPVANPPEAPAPAAHESRIVKAHIDLGAGGGEGDATIGVDIELRGPSAELGELRLASGAHGTLAGLALRDDRGAMSFETVSRGESLEVRLGRAVQGVLDVHYRVESTVAGFDDAVATTVGPDRVRVSGETAFLLPTAFEQQGLSAELTFDLSRLPPGSAVASTLGRELSQLRCTGSELRHASFMGGKLNSARFVTDHGIDEWVWLEELGFDARPVSGEAAALRSELARYFESRTPSPYVVLASASVRLDGSFTAATRSGGLLLELPVDTSWAGPTRISVCREFFRPWLGAEVRLVGDSDQPSPSELWFNEGVARALARELLFRFGMLTADEYSDEINGVIGSVALSPFVAMPGAQVAGRADVLARRHLTARGVLYATALAARLRAIGKGSRALDPILRDLFVRVRAEHRPLTLTDWLAAAGNHAGAAAESEYQRIVQAGQLPVFATGGLGPCFQLVRRRYVEFELGFDLANSRRRPEGILGLSAHGPAARAGLRSTDHLLSAHYTEGDPSVMAVLDVERAGKRITLEYPPVGRRVEGPAWTRRNNVPEAACLSQ